MRPGNNRKFVALAALAFVALVVPRLPADEAPVLRPLAGYPESARLWLGSFGAEVEVDPATDLLPSRPGEVRWLAESGAAVEDGQPVALMGGRQIEQSAAQLAIDESQVGVRKRNVEWSHRDKLAGIERQVDEFRSRLAKLEMTPQERELIGDALMRRLAGERLQIERQITELEEKMDPLHHEEELRLELAQIDQDIGRARLDHEELLRSMEILAEHDGVVEIDFNGYARANQVIGRIRRTGHALVTLQVLDPEIRAEPPETLVVTVTGPDGVTHEGGFLRVERGLGGRLAPASYLFDLTADGDGELSPDLSGERMATLYKVLPQPARIVTKSPLLFGHAEAINRLGWAGFLKTVWPEARILHIGPQSIAVVPES